MVTDAYGLAGVSARQGGRSTIHNMTGSSQASVDDTRRHVVVIGAGAVGSATAIEALGAGLRLTVLEPDEPGGTQAASFGNAAWLSPHSVVPPALHGAWWVPGPMFYVSCRCFSLWLNPG